MLYPTTPRVFVSAASSDLRSARNVVNEALTRIECLPVEESVFGTEYGPVREMLQRKIESCQAVVHLVGRDYGGEPDPRTLPEGQPRRSWTQIEYDLARQQNKKLYVVVCDDSFPFDPIATPESDEKTALHNTHRVAVLGDEHLWHTVQDLDALRQQIENLKVPLDEVRDNLRRQQARHRLQTGGAAAAIVLVLTGVVYGLSQLGKQVGDTSAQVADVGLGVQGVGTKLDAVPEQIDEARQETVRQLSDPAALAATIRQKIESTAVEKIAALPDEQGRWQKVAEIEQRRDVTLGRIDDLIRLIQEGLREGASPIFTRATEILEKEGFDAALAYLESRRPSTLDVARRQAARAEAQKQQRNQALQPLLLEADLLEAKLDWQSALELRKQVVQLAPDWSGARGDLGKLLLELALFPGAEPHLRSALALAITPEEESTALNNLAQLLQAADGLEAKAEAERLLRRALALDEQSYGAGHPEVATDLSNLAQLLHSAGRLAEAEPLIRRAVAIDEQSYGTEPPVVAIRLNNLVGVLQATNRLAEAEPLMRRSLAIWEQFRGAAHPGVASDLNNLASLLQARNHPAEAELLYRRALAIDEQSYGAEHPNVANDLSNLAQLLSTTSRQPETEPLMRRALAIDEQSYGAEHPTVALRLNNLARLLQDTDRLTEAEPLMRRAFVVFASRLGKGHANTIKMQKNYRSLLTAMDVPSEEIDRRVNEAVDTAGPLEPIAPEAEQLVGPVRSVDDVLAALDRQYKEEGRPAVYFLPLGRPISPHLDELLGPSTLDWPLDQPITPYLDELLGPVESVRQVLDDLDRQYRRQGKPDIWFLPLDEPISPHLDELLGPMPEDAKESAASAPNRKAARSDTPLEENE